MLSPPAGEWSSPSIIGEPPCPCDSFTLTLVGERRAALFGGMSGSGSYCDDLLIVELSSDTVVSVTRLSPLIVVHLAQLVRCLGCDHYILYFECMH